MGYLDTGAMYRAVAYLAARAASRPATASGSPAIAGAHRLAMRPMPGGMAIAVDGTDVTEQIRRPEVTASVSTVAAHPGVRAAITAVQREVLGTGSWVCDGRDVGTTVWPDAELKVFLTASVAERARRRCAELAARGTPEPLADVEAGHRGARPPGCDAGREPAARRRGRDPARHVGSHDRAGGRDHRRLGRARTPAGRAVSDASAARIVPALWWVARGILAPLFRVVVPAPAGRGREHPDRGARRCSSPTTSPCGIRR